MSARQFVFPRVTAIPVSRSAPHAQRIAAPSQRDLVAASLLLCPYGKKADARREDRIV
jgi:hypothetical protein